MDFARLAPHLSLEPLAVNEVLIKATVPISRIHFVESGIVSLIAISSDGERSESGLVGSEGVVGVPVLLGADRVPGEARVQLAGLSMALSAERLGEVVRDSPALHGLLLRYAQVLAIQVAYTALANARYRLDQRLARWLVMSRDRADSDTLPTTRSLLALMLGVNRPGLSAVVASLERQGLIETRRGSIIIRDQARLRDLAGAAYGIPEEEYTRLLER